jgi:hypothetical protein
MEQRATISMESHGLPFNGRRCSWRLFMGSSLETNAEPKDQENTGRAQCCAPQLRGASPFGRFAERIQRMTP